MPFITGDASDVLPPFDKPQDEEPAEVTSEGGVGLPSLGGGHGQ